MIFRSDFLFFRNLSLQLGSEGFKLYLSLREHFILRRFLRTRRQCTNLYYFCSTAKTASEIHWHKSFCKVVFVAICQVFNSFCISSLKNYSLVNQNFELSLIIIYFLFFGIFFYSVDLCLVFVMFVQLLFKSKIKNPQNADFKPLHIPSSKSSTSNLVT